MKFLKLLGIFLLLLDVIVDIFHLYWHVSTEADAFSSSNRVEIMPVEDIETPIIFPDDSYLPVEGAPSAASQEEETSPQAVDISDALKNEYADKLAAIKKTSFCFAWIDEYQKFLNKPEIAEYDKKQKDNINKLSYQLKVAKDVKEALNTNLPDASLIKQRIGKYAADRAVPRPIRVAICAVYLGDYRANNHRDYHYKADIAVALSHYCNSYDEMLAIIDKIFDN